MSRQKTVAKWLIVILLTTLAIGCYVAFDTLYKPDNVTASGNDGNNGAVPDEKPPVHIPYYTELPRANDDVRGISVAHVGGEGSDAVKAAMTVGTVTLMVISSDSDEYDMRGDGLYIAAIRENALLSCVRFTEENEKVLSFKTAFNGVVLLTDKEESAKLYLFGYDGVQKAECEIENADDGVLYYHSNIRELWYYGIFGGRLTAAKVTANLALEYDNLFLQTDKTVISEIFPNKHGIMLVLSDDSGCDFVSYSQYQSFNTVKSYTEMRFMQIDSIKTDIGTGYVILGAAEDGLVITAVDAEFKQTARAFLKDENSAVMITGETDLALLSSKGFYRFCHHLDLLEKSVHSMSGEPFYTRSIKDRKIVITRRETGLAVYEFLTPQSFLVLLDVDGVSDVCGIELNEKHISLSFTAHSANDVTYANFGKSDAFYVTAPLAAAD